MIHRPNLISVLLTLPLLAACGSEGENPAPIEPDGGSPEGGCEPGSSEGCACSDGNTGTRTCTGEGLFGSCECSDPVECIASEGPQPCHCYGDTWATAPCENDLLGTCACPALPAPVLDQPSGTYDDPAAFQCVTIQNAVRGATVRYTLTEDGSEPPLPDATARTLDGAFCGLPKRGLVRIKLVQEVASVPTSPVADYRYALNLTPPTASAFDFTAKLPGYIDDNVHFRITCGPSAVTAFARWGEREVDLSDSGEFGDAVSRDSVYERDYTLHVGDDAADAPVFGECVDSHGNRSESLQAKQLASFDTIGLTVTADLDGQNHWTPEDNPVVLTGIISLAGGTLVIDPGTVIVSRYRFVVIGGDVIAMGTPTQPIDATRAHIELGSGSGKTYYDNGDYWKGSRFENVAFGTVDVDQDSGAYFRHVDIEHLGVLHGTEEELPEFSSGHLRGTYIGYSRIGTLDNRPVALDNDFNHHISLYDTLIEHSNIGAFYWYADAQTEQIIRRNQIGELRITLGLADASALTGNVLGHVTWFGTKPDSKITGNVFAPGPTGEALAILQGDPAHVIDASGNYWGAAATQTLEMLSEGENLAVIRDQQDDAALPRVNVAGFLLEAPQAGPDGPVGIAGESRE